jgi:predicted transglutaminase-like protease
MVVKLPKIPPPATKCLGPLNKMGDIKYSMKKASMLLYVSTFIIIMYNFNPASKL